jgi:thiamine pyrophosphate-dependent acetolactate synthase large subunit-like protein
MAHPGAQLVIDTLVARGVKHLFSLSGNHILSLYDATIGREPVDYVRARCSSRRCCSAWSL